MTQSNPSILLYGQALVLLKQLADAYAGGILKTNTEVQNKIQEILTQYESSMGTPLTKYEPISETEPPLSAKMNRFWNAVQHDVALMQNQIDIIRSSAVFVHNLIASETEKASQLNAVVRNKLKTLQLYTNAVDNNQIVFGDNFHNSEFIDSSKIRVGEQAFLEPDNFLTLGHVGPLVDLTAAGSIRILSDVSNGFAGNNQEVANPTTATKDITGAPILTFIAESQIANDLLDLIDGNPNTWFEYESWLISDADKLSAQKLNFEYNMNTTAGTAIVDWSGGPSGGVLKLALEIDLGSITQVNQVSYIPFGLTDNVNLPVKVASVKTSSDGTTWTQIFPQNVWVGTDVNLEAARTADNVVTRRVAWSIDDLTAQYVRIYLEQPNPISRPAGHIYWVDKKNNAIRVKGAVPFFDTLERFYRPSNQVVGNAVQRREYFPSKRWAIGVRDITVSQINYRAQSTAITTPIRVGGVVDRVALEADIFIPNDFDSSQSWIDFFVSPNDGVTWFQISRIQDDFLAIPEIIAFNDPTPVAFRERGVAYYDVPGTVSELRVKFVLRRPDDLTSQTPIIRSYKLKIKRR